MTNEKILIVDDDDKIRELLHDRLRSYGYEVFQAENGRKGLEITEKVSPDLMLLDLKMPEMGGLEVLKTVTSLYPELIVIILTAFSTIEGAIKAMKLGAYDFLPKPCKPDHIMVVIRKALSQKKLREENILLRHEIEELYKMIVGTSPEMFEIMKTAKKAAVSRSTVLIGGESGTGKQLLARAIHAMSERNDRAFIQVNCTTLSDELLESDLFGHERGAFTGAHQMKKGRVELAHRGTLFLDEIGDISSKIQAKLLHFLEQGEFERVGGMNPMKVDARVIVATNKNLEREVAGNRFREDLFYRLNVVKLELPPLRTRIKDIPLLTDHFLDKFCRELNKPKLKIGNRVLQRLREYNWPGNIRELENTIERAVVLVSGSEITEDLLPEQTAVDCLGNVEAGLHLDEAVLKFKQSYIHKTLEMTNNNQTKAAQILDIQRTYLNRLIREMKE